MTKARSAFGVVAGVEMQVARRNDSGFDFGRFREGDGQRASASIEEGLNGAGVYFKLLTVLSKRKSSDLQWCCVLCFVVVGVGMK